MESWGVIDRMKVVLFKWSCDLVIPTVCILHVHVGRSSLLCVNHWNRKLEITKKLICIKNNSVCIYICVAIEVIEDLKLWSLFVLFCFFSFIVSVRVIVYCNFLVIVKNDTNTNTFITVIRPSQFLTQRTAKDCVTSVTH